MSIASNLKAQLVSQLIETLGNASPVAGLANTSVVNKGLAALQATTLAAFQNGQILQAIVTGTTGKDRLNLLVNGTPLTADLRGATLPSEALRTGAQIQLRVETAGELPRLVFQSITTATAAAGAYAPVRPNPSSEQAQTSGTAPAEIITPPAPAPAVKQASAATSMADIITRTTSTAAARQGSAAPLYADLAAVLERPQASQPQPLVKLAEALLANRLDGERPISGKDVQQALAGIGIGQNGPDTRPQQDIKALLQLLRDSLLPAGKETPRTPADQEPPRRDGPISAHRPVAASIARETDPQVVNATVAREAEQAVERMKLHQLASLPERVASPEPGQLQANQTRQFNFEIPIAFGQQTAMAGFRIERDRKRNTRPDEPVDVWGVRFAIDADILGPVHAHLRLAGNSISVSLWAEEAMTHRFFVDAMPILEAALSENALEIGEIKVFAGKPAEPRAAASGHFLDRRS